MGGGSERVMICVVVGRMQCAPGSGAACHARSLPHNGRAMDAVDALATSAAQSFVFDIADTSGNNRGADRVNTGAI